MRIEQTLFPDVIKIIPTVYFDDRGFFYESFKSSLLKEAGLVSEFVQDNHSFSKKNVLRGMHFQKGQTKLINVISGVIFDVFVDIRKDSKTFGKWQGVVLDGQKKEILLIPDGFAHGFYVLSDEAHLVYKVSNVYDPYMEKSFRYDDPFVSIQWPEGKKILSQRDQSNLSLQQVVL